MKFPIASERTAPAKAQRHQGQKFEARNPKFETISNDQNIPNSKQASFGFGGFGIFPIRGLFVRQFVSDFDIRISDLLGCSLARGNPVSGTDLHKNLRKPRKQNQSE
jgi:hypothetical protein